MNNLFVVLTIFSGISFFIYGYNCFFSEFMIQEFDRFRLSKPQRIITGVAQMLGAVGLFLGLFYPFFGLLAAFGLSLLMLMGFVVRLKIKDKLKESLPSFIFMILNGYLFWQFYTQITYYL